MRLFIAIGLSEEVKAALIDAQNDLYDKGVRGNFSPEENLHITLAFIGEYGDPDEVLEALSGIKLKPFEICLDGCGSFGDLWWAGIRPCPALNAVVRRVRRRLAEANIPFDRKQFDPHITLVRKAENAVPVQIKNAAMTVDRISLMRSDRGKRGMIYTELGQIQ